jgi:hypothetical protein
MDWIALPARSHPPPAVIDPRFTAQAAVAVAVKNVRVREADVVKVILISPRSKRAKQTC